MVSGSPLTRFEPLAKIDTSRLKWQLRSCFGIGDVQLAEVKEALQSSKQDFASYDSESRQCRAVYEKEKSRMQAEYSDKTAILRTKYEGDIHRIQLRLLGLKSYTENLSTLLAPIRRVPMDVLLHIFVLGCTQDDVNAKNSTALTISAVCTCWRQLTKSQSTIWANFQIRLEEYEEPSAPEVAQLVFRVNLYLARSRSYPLTLRILPEKSRDHPALKLIAQESQRWKHLSFGGDDFGGFDGNSCLRSLQLPMLEAVCFEESEYCTGLSPPLETFGNAPNIRKLSLHSSLDQNVAAIFCKNWEKLTSLECDLVANLEGFLSVLDRCTQLRHLTVEGENVDLIPIPPLRISSLHSLKLVNSQPPSNEHDSMLECLLASLVLPNLISLVLLHAGDIGQCSAVMPYSILRDFFRRSHCSLLTLTIRQISITDAELVALLVHVPCLQELSCEDPVDGPALITADFIRSLHSCQRNGHHSIEPLVPKLRSLRLKVHKEEFDTYPLFSMVTSRWLPDDTGKVQLGTVCLKLVEVHLRGVVDKNTYELLGHFDRAGMQVVVKTDELLV
ncbi:hypothetical protein EV359DRAFT_66143 [Lentinula novae-zelandiae]|nr:hypothetical protein EV359DRAFT_66143 [Lentinula novae-zelandiae]